MSARPARRVRDGVLGLGSLVVLAAGMWGINETLRSTVANAAGERSIEFLPTANLRLSQVNHMVSHTLGVSIADHMPLVFFACVSLVLFVVMVRS